MYEALHYERQENENVKCVLCPHECLLAPGKRGVCRVRRNIEGTLFSENYGKCASIALDPIEKKPLYHFHPGSLILSVGSKGCNFKCRFCQNWMLAHGDPPLQEITPSQLVEIAEKETPPGFKGIAYTYAEPLVWYEFVLETAGQARDKGIKNVLVTNGFINPEPLQEIIPLIDALNIDVKSFSSKFYRKLVKGELKPVLATAEEARRSGAHLELTTLVIPSLNDSEEEIQELVNWVEANLGADTPLHLSRYFPNYKLDLPPTPVETLTKLRELALRKLNYVYLGNTAISEANSTYCPSCGQELIRRTGYDVSIEALNGSYCAQCNEKIAIVL